MNNGLPAGTLLRVLESALEEGMHAEFNTEEVAENGWLWRVFEDEEKQENADDDIMLTTSLATGVIGWWYPEEVEILGGDDA